MTSIFQDDSAFTTYGVTIEFTGRLIGGAPSDPKIVESWLATKVGITDEEQLQQWTLRHLAETQGLDPATATITEVETAIGENAIEKKAQVFKRTALNNPYVEPRHVKAMLKEATAIAFPRGEVKFGQYRNGKGAVTGGKEPKSFVAERVFVVDAPILVGDDVDGIDLAVGHIPDWKAESGKRSTLGYFEYVETPKLTFDVNVLDDCLTGDQWRRIWQVAERNGLGARRSQGAGQFVVTRFDRV